MALLDEARALLDQIRVEFTDIRSEGTVWNEDEAGWLDVVLRNPTDATFLDVTVTFSVTGPVALEERALRMNSRGNAGNAGNAGAIGPVTDRLRLATGRDLLPRGGEMWLQVKLIPEGSGGAGLSIGVDAQVAPTPTIDTVGRTLLSIAPA